MLLPGELCSLYNTQQSFPSERISIRIILLNTTTPIGVNSTVQPHDGVLDNQHEYCLDINQYSMCCSHGSVISGDIIGSAVLQKRHTTPREVHRQISG